MGYRSDSIAISCDMGATKLRAMLCLSLLTQAHPDRIRERKISLKFSCRKFSGHRRPRLWVKDVSAKNLIFLRSERWDERFWVGTSARISARKSAGYPAQQLYVWAAFPFLKIKNLSMPRFFMGCFPGRFSRVKTTHYGIRGNGPLGRGNGPLTLMGSFQAPRHGGKRPLQKGSLLGGIKRDKLNGTNGFLRKSAVSCSFQRKICGFLRFSAKICASEMLQFPRKAKICKNQRKSAKEKLRIWLRLSLLVLSLLIPLDIKRSMRRMPVMLAQASVLALTTSGMARRSCLEPRLRCNSCLCHS